MKRTTLMVLAGLSTLAIADPTIDGTADAMYGGPLAVQDTPTGFGDSNLGQINYANGSELDAAYAVITGSTLFVTIAGNLESNFNKIEVFIDSIGGGQNQLRGDNPDVDFNGLNRMAGLTFDSDFAADYYITSTCGGGTFGLYNNYAELLTNGGGSGGYLGSNDGQSGGILGGGNNPYGIQVALNNSNTAGVSSSSASGAGSVTTGLEYAIPLAALGNPTGMIKVSAFINGGGHDFISNQVLGGIGGAGNIGEPSQANFSNLAGNQYFAVPEPGTVAAFALGGIFLVARKRRSK
ncbi:MAG TPA: PEP-CTERM sorting domain-containing protein [Fimbriimonadaceae bacterium]|nr:PEP-CTERM sorting domain-containing protein [Fimbriimonadaceae bacterium]